MALSLFQAVDRMPQRRGLGNPNVLRRPSENQEADQPRDYRPGKDAETDRRRVFRIAEGSVPNNRSMVKPILASSEIP